MNCLVTHRTTQDEGERMNTLVTAHRVIAAVARRTYKLAVLFFILSIAARAQSTTSTDGQTPLGLEPGAPAGAYALSGFDNINLYNGNLNFRLPLMHIGGRGGAQMTMALPIETHWRVLHLSLPPIPPNPPSESYFLLPSMWNPIQPGYGPGVLIGRQTGTPCDCGVSLSPQIRYTLTRLTFITPDGTEYELRDQLTQGKPADLGSSSCLPPPPGNFGRGRVFVTGDGSAMTFISDTLIDDRSVYSEFIYPTGYLFLRDGTRFRIENGIVISITDRNGNQLLFEYDQYKNVTAIIDSLNRRVTITYGNSLNGATYDEISWKGFQGATRRIRVWGGWLRDRLRGGTAQGSTGYTLRTMHSLFPEMPGQDDQTNFDWPVISAVELPDGRRYEFYYNSYVELARVELPTGGPLSMTKLQHLV
jgi:YD repeat-containing protein